ncbi:hypothetical protein QTV49_001840 [Vibrio vulnificus]|nr:hypothetical protein [Vibrio vulnificus]
MIKKSMHVGVIDLSSNIYRTYKTSQKDASKNNSLHYIGDIPVYCIKNTILQLIKEQNAIIRKRGELTHMLAVLDFGGSNFRHEIYPEYKANRDPEDPELTVQKIIIERVLNHLGYTVIKVPNVEADDVIGTVVTKCSDHGIKTTVFSRDKDLFAFIDKGNVMQYSGAEKVLFGWQTVVDSKGVTPDRITDMLTLMGDKADNIIGVKGFGAKSASAILAVYSLDEILDDPYLILKTGVRGAKGLVSNLQNSAEQISLMRKVATVKTDIELNQSLRDWQYSRSKKNIDSVISQSIKELITEGEI